MDKLACVGKNYAEHAKELAAMIGDGVPAKPVVFIKPPSVLKAATKNGEKLELRLPSESGAIHHECEIVLQLSHGGYQLSAGAAERAIGAVTVGLDMTLRDVQTRLKKDGHPWTVAKVFPDAAIVGPWVKLADFPGFLGEPFTLSVDGKKRQEGRAREMILSPAACVQYISQFFPLCAGDLIFTGTPAGVGPVQPGQEGELRWGKLAYSVTWVPFRE